MMRRSQRKLSANDLIGILSDGPRFVVKTFLSRGRGPVYSLDHNMQLVPNEVAERLIDKGTLVPREESGQTFGLSERWGNPVPARTWGTF